MGAASWLFRLGTKVSVHQEALDTLKIDIQEVKTDVREVRGDVKELLERV